MPNTAIQKEEISDLIGAPPGWILRSGIGLIFGAVAAGLALSFFIQYPDRLEATAFLTTENPPVGIVAASGGKLERLAAADRTIVSQGDILALLENPAKAEDMQTLKQFVERVETSLWQDRRAPGDFPKDLQVGSLQPTYVQLLRQYESRQYFLREDPTERQVAALQSEIDHLWELNASLERQMQLYREELALQEKDYRRSEQLFEGGTISAQELEKARTVLLQQQRQLESMAANEVQNRIRGEQLAAQIRDLRSRRSETAYEHRSALGQLCEQFKGEWESWDQAYVVRAAISGRLDWLPGLGEGQYVGAGAPLGAVIPAEGEGRLLARCQLPPQRLGKLESGARALIRLDAYPYREYGALRAELETLPLMPVQNEKGERNYILDIPLPDSLVTNYGKVIPFQPELSGRAVIITEKRSLLARVFEQLASVVRME